MMHWVLRLFQIERFFKIKQNKNTRKIIHELKKTFENLFEVAFWIDNQKNRKSPMVRPLDSHHIWITLITIEPLRRINAHLLQYEYCN